MAMKAKHAFGSSEGLESAIQSGKIDSFDILFLDGDTDKPKIGWIDKNGKPVILKDEKADLSELESDVEAIESELATKADAKEVEEKLDKVVTDSVASAKAYTDGKVEAAVNEHLVKKFEISNVPDGTLVDYKEKEIRIMCPENSVFVEQSVGTGGDSSCYYCTFKTFAPKEAVGYIEHLNGQVDEKILTDLKTDEYDRKYQPTWLALAKKDADIWNYYGKNSSKEKMIGYDYQIDWFNANGTMIASDSIRINLSNEKCHFINEPYYVGRMMKEFDVKIEEKIEEKIAEVESAYEIVEF